MKHLPILFSCLLASLCVGAWHLPHALAQQVFSDNYEIAQTAGTTRTLAMSMGSQAGPHAQIARQSAVAALLHDGPALQNGRRQAMQTQEFLTNSGNAFPLMDILGLLEAWNAPSASQRNRILKNVARKTDNTVVWRQARDALRLDPLRRISQLQHENRYNHLTGLFNYSVRFASNLLTLNTEGLVRLSVDFLFVWEPLVAITPQDRAAIAVFEEYHSELGVDGQSQSRAVSWKIGSLRGKRTRQAYREQMQAARWNMRRQRWNEAHFAYTMAEQLNPGDGAARKGKLEAGSRLSAIYRQRMHMLQAGSQAQLPQNEAQFFKDLGMALVSQSPDQIRKIARSWRTAHPASPYLDDAAYAEWVADSLRKPSSTTDSPYAEALILSAPLRGSAAQELVKAFHESADANPAAALRKAEKRVEAEALAYVLMGRKENADYPAIYPQIRQQWHAAAASLGLLLPLDWIRRSAQMILSNPLDDSFWRDAAVQFLAYKNPQAPVSRETAARLAQSYERQGMLNQARQFHALAHGKDLAYERKLDEQAASRLLEIAEAQENLSQKQSVLRMLAERYPRTKASGKARKAMAQYGRGEAVLFEIAKKDLLSWPDLWLNRGLRLDPGWFDGSHENGEMDDAGIRFLGQQGRRVAFTLSVSGKSREEHILNIEEPFWNEVEPRLQAWKREANARARAEALLERPAFLLDIQGSAGPGGLDIYPQLQPIRFDEETLPLYRSPYEAP